MLSLGADEIEEPGWFLPELTSQQRELWTRARAFVDRHVYPYAHEFDADQAIPAETLSNASEAGIWSAAVSREHGGEGADSVGLGLLSQELGRGSASLLSLFTVHSMLCAVLERWGKPAQKARWLPELATGRRLAALALTEPQSGSDAGNILTRIEKTTTGAYRITGRKRWISGGEIAGLILVIGSLDGKPTALIVDPEESAGLRRTPIRDLNGFRAAQLAELEFANCEVPADNLIGRVGFGLSLAAGYALDLGRLCVASGAVGVCNDCLRLSATYARSRSTFGKKLAEQPLIQRLLAHMANDLATSRLICHQAAKMRDAHGTATEETALAKFHACSAAQRASDNALHIHAAHGLTATSAIQRHWRDARIFEIIEGTTQLQETLIGKAAARIYGRDSR